MAYFLLFRSGWASELNYLFSVYVEAMQTETRACRSRVECGWRRVGTGEHGLV